MMRLPTLTKKRLVIIAAVVIVLAVIVGLLAWAPWKTQPTAARKQMNTTPGVAVIEITSSGFLPSTLEVNPNTNIVWVNEDVMPHLPAADPYPTHTSMPSLVPSRALGQHESYTYHVSRQETIHYHDDLTPTLTGTIVVR